VFNPSPEFPAEVHSACLAAGEHAGKLLESLGHHVDTGYPAALDAGLPPTFFAIATSLIAWEVAEVGRVIGRDLTEADVEPVVWAASRAGQEVTAVMYQDAIADLRSLVRDFAAWWDSWDLLVTPTLAVPPYPIGATTAPTSDAPWPDVGPWIPFTPQFNLSGQPAISLPLDQDDAGLPVGVQLGAALGREDLLISVAAQLEEAEPWCDRWPPTSIANRASLGDMSAR
jgi:amidase